MKVAENLPLFYCLVCLCFPTAPASSKRTSDLIKEVLDQILANSDGNEVQVPPGNGTEGPTRVEIFAHVLSIDKLDEEKMEFTLSLLLKQKWTDSRLKYDDNMRQISYVVTDDVARIWRPSLYFLNEKKSHSFNVFRPYDFAQIYPDGSVLQIKKVSVTVPCQMSLKWFPFDKQKCHLRLGSYVLVNGEVWIDWKDHFPVSSSASVYMPMFRLTKFAHDSNSVSLNNGVTFNNLKLSFHLARNLQHYIYHVFIPCSMLVVLAWIQFWINKKVLIARLLIGLFALLISITSVQNMNQNRAKVSYSTYMDFFTGVFLTIVLASFVETVVVHALDERNERDKDGNDSGNNDPPKRANNGRIASIKVWLAKVPSKTDKIDTAARIIVPVFYLLFCIIYFCTGTAMFSEDDPDSE